MWRLTYCFFFGTIVTALPLDALSVYALHDVDRDQVGQWNAAFIQLADESMIFSIIVSGLLLLLLSLGRKLFHHHKNPLNIRLGFLLGVGTVVIQYVFDIAARLWIPAISQTMLSVYLLLFPLVCAAILLRNSSLKLPRTQ